MRILIIEDDQSTAEMLAFLLRAKNYNPYCADCGEEGLDLAKRYRYDLILLDTTLPDLHGLNVLRHMRASRVHTPVIVVSSEISVELKVKMLRAGADDYITKPFHKDELLARVVAVVRRTLGYPASVVEIGDLRLDLERQILSVSNNELRLSPKQYGMMELLALRKGTVVTRGMFMDHLYDGLEEPEPKIIDVFVHHLRKKIAVATNTGPFAYIEDVRGRGFVLRAPCDVAA